MEESVPRIESRVAAWRYIEPISEERSRWFIGICMALGKLSQKRK